MILWFATYQVAGLLLLVHCEQQDYLLGFCERLMIVLLWPVFLLAMISND